MARSDHSNYSAADRFERKAARRRRPTERRQSTRSAILAATIAQVA
jgi:hypothetical protein